MQLYSQNPIKEKISALLMEREIKLYLRWRKMKRICIMSLTQFFSHNKTTGRKFD